MYTSIPEEDMLTSATCHHIVRKVLQNIPPKTSNNLIKYAQNKPDIIRLELGQSDSTTPDFIINAATKAMQDGHTFYGPVLGIPELRDGISQYYQTIYNLDITSDRVFVTASGSSAIHYTFLSILDEGDEVIAITPLWKNLLGSIELSQSRVVDVPLQDTDGQWHLNTQDVFDAYTDKTKAILINTPSNPTGWVMPREDMEKIMDFARANNIWVISDEVYGRIVYDGTRAPSFLDVSQPDDQLIVINSFSKAWSMTGWRLGWVVAPASMENIFYDIILHDNMCTSPFIQYGGIAALRDGEDFIQQQIRHWDHNRTLIKSFFDMNPNIIGHIPQSSFYGFFKVKDKPDTLKLVMHFIDKAGVCLLPGCSFGEGGEGYIRISFAVSTDKLKKALDLLNRAL